MKQTAVQWFYEEIWRQFGFSCSSNILDKAKEMERQQIINASAIAYEDMFGANGTEYGKEYYNKTYKRD
jgi:predicted double-glycine peptidase